LDHLGPTVELTLLALVLGAGLAVPLGCLMAQTRGKRADVALRVAAIAGLTVPSFWLGIVLILLLAEVAPGFASLGYVPFRDDPLGNLSRMALPALGTGAADPRQPVALSCAPPCSTPSARTTSAPPGPRARTKRSSSTSMRCATR
jgi:ABC-type proline/glycine betaine transport system permease subunit